MHKLLARQLRKLLPAGIPTESLNELLSAISAAYDQADHDRRLLERSLELSSRELTEQYRDLHEKLEEIEATRHTLEQSLSLLNATLNATSEGILVLDETGNLLAYNQVFLEIFGILSNESRPIDRQTVRLYLQQGIRNLDELNMAWSVSRADPGCETHCQLETVDGRYLEVRSKPRLVDGRAMGRVWSVADITALKLSEQQALYHSYHDPVTGLPNRTLFQERLSHALELCAVDENELAVLFVDLDDFKQINVSRGLDCGNRILRLVGERLRQRIPKDATVARQSSDEFLILVRGIRSSFTPTLIAEKVRSSLQEPFALEGEQLHLSCSIGIALAPTDGLEAETLIRKADIAMSQAKRRGRNTFQFFAREYEALASQRLQIRNNLRQALLENEFRLLYQPKVALSGSPRITGCEALIRWQKPDGSIISPLQFIPAAEEYGFIVDIGNWVIQTACRQLETWRSQRQRMIPIAVNISAHHVQQPGLVDTVREALLRYRISPDLLEIEVTESALMQNLDATIQTLRALREMGVHVSIDDFGTGYSSLNYLKSLPVDTLKIDRSFINDMLKSRRDYSLVRTIINLAHTLDMSVVAEGVEVAPTVTALRDSSCDMAQGYFFSRPIDPDALQALQLTPPEEAESPAPATGTTDTAPRLHP